MHKVDINYIVKVMWPGHCRNRSLKVLEERADIVETMNGHRKKIEIFVRHHARMHTTSATNTT